MVIVGAPAPSAALAIPPAREVIDRVLAESRGTDLTSVAMAIQFRIGTPVTAPPACVFEGILHVSPDRALLAVSRWTPSVLCWTIERYALGRLFDDRDHIDAVLAGFRFDVIGERVVDGRPAYLVYGRPLAPNGDPQWMVGWVDYARGLVTDGSIQYGWGRVDLAQQYGLVEGVWVLTHQQLDVPRFNASLDITYSEYRFGARPP